MDTIDRQDWAVGASFTAYGLRIGVRANTEQALSAVVESLPLGLKRKDVSEVDLLYSVVAGNKEQTNRLRRFSLAYANSTQLVRSLQFGDVPEAVERDLSIEIAELAKNRVFIHAGVVGWKGNAILIPGRSRAGKSTLVAALLRAGASYYSDDFGVVDRRGFVHPYQRPLQLRNSDGTTRRVPAADLLAEVGTKPLRVRLVLIAQYRKRASWRPIELRPGEGLLAVLTNTVSAQRQPARALKTLAAMLAGALVLKGTRGEAERMVALLREAGHLAL